MSISNQQTEVDPRQVHLANLREAFDRFEAELCLLNGNQFELEAFEVSLRLLQAAAKLRAQREI